MIVAGRDGDRARDRRRWLADHQDDGHQGREARPVHGFAAETTAATVIFGASHLGMPVSTTHVISSAIMGVGSSDRFNAVRWGVARNIGVAWVLTLPAAGIVAALAYLLLNPILGARRAA